MKKWLIVLGIITCIFGLTACGGIKVMAAEAAEAADAAAFITEAEALEIGDALVGDVIILTTYPAGSFAEGSLEAEVIASWNKAMEDMGSYVGIIGHTAVINGDEAVVTVTVEGTKSNADVEIVLHKTEGIKSIITNVKSSFKPTLGMGIIVGILIGIIIFAFVSKIRASHSGKPTEETKIEAAAGDPAIAQIIEKEELSDDFELVAVIAAAIAASEGAATVEGFRVRSIKRAGAAKWQRA